MTSAPSTIHWRPLARGVLGLVLHVSGVLLAGTGRLLILAGLKLQYLGERLKPAHPPV